MRVLDNRQTIHRQLAMAEACIEQLDEQLQQARRLSGLGLAWSLTAHEVNNLLAPMTSYAQLALQYPDDTELNKKALEKAVMMGQRAGHILEKIMELASGRQFEEERVDVNALLDDVLQCMGRDFGKDGIELVRDCPPGTTVQADGLLLGQALMNLILNARRAMLGKGGALTLAARPTHEGLMIAVSDTGCGMTPEVAARIFEPFFSGSGKQVEHEGNGLGLLFCKQIIEAHHGRIEVESQLGTGTTFRIQLPND